MNTAQILRLKSLDQLANIQKARERVEKLKNRFHLADTAFGLAWSKFTAMEKEASKRGDFHHHQLSKARQAAAEAESTMRAAAGALEASRGRLRQTRARVWNQVESVLIEERRHRIKEAVSAIQKAVEANQRIYEMDCKFDKLAPPGTERRGSLVFDAGWQDLNQERFEDWRNFLKVTRVLDESELGVVKSDRETKRRRPDRWKRPHDVSFSLHQGRRSQR